MDSILTSIKKLLGIDEAYEHFDKELIIHINSVLAILNQLGVGPKEGFSITDSSDKWSDFIKDAKTIEFVKSYVHLKVRLMFDPPDRAAVLESMKRITDELEWRIQVAADSVQTTGEEEIQNGK